MSSNRLTNLSLIKKLKELKTKFTLELYKSWEEEDYFRSPKWFLLLELIAFGKDFINKREEEKINMLEDFEPETKLQKALRNRILNRDYTLFLPEILYKLVYRYDSALSDEYLILFYSSILAVLVSGGNELRAIIKISKLRNTPVTIKKLLYEWEVDIRDGNRGFALCLLENKKTFGEFASSIYYSTQNAGIFEKVLKKIIKRLEDNLQISKAKRKIKRGFLINVSLLTIGIYYVFAMIIPQIVDAIGAPELPGDIQLMYSLGLFLKTPLGFIVFVLVLLLTYFLAKLLKENETISGLVITIPGLGDFISYTELYSFIDCLCIYMNYLDGTDDKQIEKSIDTVSNSFIKGFFNYKLKSIRDDSLSVEEFFKNNRVFREFSDFLAIDGRFKDKIEALRLILEKGKDDVLARLPELMENFTTVVTIFIVVIVVMIAMRVQVWSADPALFNM